jgi:hypothetical protein
MASTRQEIEKYIQVQMHRASTIHQDKMLLYTDLSTLEMIYDDGVTKNSPELDWTPRAILARYMKHDIEEEEKVLGINTTSLIHDIRRLRYIYFQFQIFEILLIETLSPATGDEKIEEEVRLLTKPAFLISKATESYNVEEIALAGVGDDMTGDDVDVFVYGMPRHGAFKRILLRWDDLNKIRDTAWSILRTIYCAMNYLHNNIRKEWKDIVDDWKTLRIPQYLTDEPVFIMNREISWD